MFCGSSDGKESACNVGDLGSTWVENIPWRRAWQPTPIFLPGESHGQRRLGGYSPWVHKSPTRLSDFHFIHLLKNQQSGPKLRAFALTIPSGLLFSQVSYLQGSLLHFILACVLSKPFLNDSIQKSISGTFLVVQWLRIHLSMQGTWVWSLVQEDPTCCRANWTCLPHCWAHAPQLWKLS